MSVVTEVAPRRADDDAFQALQDVPREHGFEPLVIDGRIPDWLRGTLYKAGPALFSSGGRRYQHWFDGDGGVAALRFGDGRATGGFRVVQSAGLRTERAKGKRLYGGYDTITPSFFRRVFAKMKNQANTAMLAHGDQLYALMEGGLPTRIGKEDLSTLGEDNLDGTLAKNFSAHPHGVVDRKATYGFAAWSGPRTTLTLYELAWEGRSRVLATHVLPVPTMVHDFIATPKHLVFFVSPLVMNVGSFFLGRKGFASSLDWKPERGTEIIVVPIDDPEHATRFQAEPFYQWHFGNAWEEGDTIVVDFIRYDDFQSSARLGQLARLERSPAPIFRGTFWRAWVEPKRKAFRAEERWPRVGELQRVADDRAGRPTRFTYAPVYARGSDVTGLWDGIAKVEMDKGTAIEHPLPAGHYASETIFVRRSEVTEDDGALVTIVYDATTDRSYGLVLDARDLSPLATAWFDHRVPPGFHGTWVGRA